jgi:hypothetical protein
MPEAEPLLRNMRRIKKSAPSSGNKLTESPLRTPTISKTLKRVKGERWVDG